MILSRKLSFLIIIALHGLKVCGQNTGEGLPLKTVLEEIAVTHSVSFNYDSNLIKDINVKPVSTTEDLSLKLLNLTRQTQLEFNFISPSIITISPPKILCGYLHALESGAALLGVTIQAGSKYAVSDESGYFQIKNPPKNVTVKFSFIGLKTLEKSIDFFESNKCLKIYMTQELEMMSPLLVKAYLTKGINKREDWTTSIDYEEFSLLPGLIEPDVLQTVQALPSVVSTDETVSNINIRGGSNDQNLVLWDGIKMYQTGHFFGLISSFNPHMTHRSTVINNGTEASLTDGVSGTIHMQTSEKIDTLLSGVAGVNFLNAELFSNVPISKKSSFQIATRKSTNDLWSTPTYNNYFERVTQFTEAQINNSEVTNSGQNFDFYDASIRWLYQPSKKDLLRFNLILFNNNLSFDETAFINRIPRSRESNASQNTMAAALNYRREWSDDFSSSLTLTESNYQLRSINANILFNQRFLQENIVDESNIKLQHILNKNKWTFKMGYDFTEIEVINLNDIDVPRFVRRDEEVLREHAVYGQTSYRNSKKDFAARAGMRFSYISKFDKLLVEPRVSLQKTINDKLRVEVLGEFKHQNTSQIINFQNDFLGIESRRWQLTDNDSIPILQSKQVSAGVIYKSKGWLVDAKGYFKQVDGITTQSQGFTTKYEFLRTKGSYQAYGLELLTRKSFKNIYSWLSYSYIKNTYRFPELLEEQFPSNFDTTHSITLGATYDSTSWQFSAGFNYRTGRPTSIPVVGNEIVNEEINFDLANNERLDDYFRIDASVMYKLPIYKRWKSEIGASVWNISNSQNPINNFFRINDDSEVNQFTRFSLGLTTNLVFRIYF